MQVFDLTLPLDSRLSVAPGDPPLVISHATTHQAKGYEVTRVCLGTHTGTHVDAPRHFFPEGRTLDSYPLSRLVGPGVVLDCRATEPAEMGAVLAEQLRLHPVQQGGMALLWTEGALLSLEAAQQLLDSGVGVVGTDAPSLDTQPYPIHHLLLAHDVLIVENLVGLDRLGTGLVNCAFLPLALVGTDGAPLRAIAWR